MQALVEVGEHIVAKRRAIHKPSLAVERQRRIKRRAAAGFKAEPGDRMAAGVVDDRFQLPGGDPAAQEIRVSAH